MRNGVMMSMLSAALLSSSVAPGVHGPGDNSAAPGPPLQGPSPIIWTETTATTDISAERAVELARGYAGFEKLDSVTSKLALLTDTEATSLGIKSRLVWLVQFDNATYEVPVYPVPGHEREPLKRGPLTLYVAVDAKTGDFVEAFSKPKPAEQWFLPSVPKPPPGWKPDTMEEGWKRMHAQLDPATARPTCPLMQALVEAGRDPLAAGQVIVRYGAFSSPFPAASLYRVDGGEHTMPLQDGKNAWAISFVGGRFAGHGDPFGGPAGYNTEINVIVNAEDCKMMQGFYYR